MVLTHGTDLNSKENRLELEQQLKYKDVGNPNFDVSARNIRKFNMKKQLLIVDVISVVHNENIFE